MPPQLLDKYDAARVLNLTPRKVIRMARRGELPRIELPDGDIRFVEADLWVWIENRKQPAVGGAAH